MTEGLSRRGAAAPGRSAERCRGRRWHGGRRVPGRRRRGTTSRLRAARSPRRPAPASRSTVPTRPASSPRCRPPAWWPCSTSWPPTAPRWPPPCRTSPRSPAGWWRARSDAPLEPLMPPPDNLILGPTPQADSLTITVGLGASMFDDRYGLADRRPTRLVEMPAFPHDQLAPERIHGDLVVQICGGTNETCIHALRRLMRATRDSMVVRWMVPGFNQPNTLGSGRTLDPQPARVQGRDGQPRPCRHRADGRPRLGPRRRGRAGVGGRRELPRGAHHPHAGGVLGPDAAAHAGDDHRAPQGHRRAARRRPPRPTSRTSPPIPNGERFRLDGHIRLANPRTPDTAGNRILRRGFSYSLGFDTAGHFDQGLLFQCFQRDLDAGFVTVQNRLERRGARGVHHPRRRRLLLRTARRPRRDTTGTGERCWPEPGPAQAVTALTISSKAASA